MKKHKTKQVWIKLFKKYESYDWDWDQYYSKNVRFSKHIPDGKNRRDVMKNRKRYARVRFKRQYNLWKILDNKFMEKKFETRGRKPKRNIDEIINNLTETEKEDIVKRYFEILEKKKTKKDIKKESTNFNWSNTRKSYIFGLHRTTYYKRPKARVYKFDYLREIVTETFYDNKERYGSERLSVELQKKGIFIGDRTLRNYMNRWGLSTITRKAKRVGEVKYRIFVLDLVKRDYHGKKSKC